MHENEGVPCLWVYVHIIYCGEKILERMFYFTQDWRSRISITVVSFVARSVAEHLVVWCKGDPSNSGPAEEGEGEGGRQHSKASMA